MSVRLAMLVCVPYSRRRFGRRAIRCCAVGLILLTSITTVIAVDDDRRALEPRFELVHGSDELRDPRIFDIAQDRLGFMWFATFSGLVRYDGYEFRWFVNDPRDQSSLSDNRVHSLLADSDGGVWVSTWEVGLNRYDPRTAAFTRYRHDPQRMDSLDDDRIRSLYEDRKGYLWVGTMSGLNRLDRRTGRVVRFPQLTTDEGKVYAVQALTEDKQGNLWVGVYGWGLLHISPDGQLLARYRHDPGNARSLSDNRVMSVVIDEGGTLWVGTWGGGLNALYPGRATFLTYRHDPADKSSIPDDTLLNVWADRFGVWAIPMDGPLARLDPVTGRFTSHPQDPRRVGRPGPSLSGAAFEDVNGSLWLGTYGKGVQVWHPAKPRLTHYRSTPEIPGGLSDDMINVVLQDRRGAVWVGTRRGLNRLDVATGQVKVYQHESANPTSLSSSYVYALYEDRDEMLWVGTWGGGLNRFDTQAGTFSRYPCGTSDPRAISDCDVWSLLEDRSGRLWIGTYNGLNQLDRRTNRVTQYTSKPEDSSSLTTSSIYDIVETPDGTVWVATNNGFNRWVPESRTFVRYPYDPADAGGLVHRTVTVIRPRPDGSLWLGTGAGLQLVQWDKTGAPRYTLYAERVGLPRFSVRGILEDDRGELWIMTFGHGLWNFDPASGRTAHFDSSDGVSKGFDRPGWRLADGRLLLGGIDGVVVFDPSPLSRVVSPPPIAITAVAVDNEPVPALDTISGGSADVADAPPLELRPQNRSVTFQFAALDYLAPDRNRFRYRLEGYDQGWTDTDAGRRQATYTNLEPGTYLFRVIGANAAGAWNEDGAAIRFTVLPPWWRTTWFNMIAVVAVSSFLFGLHRLRLMYVVEANRRLVVEVEQRRQAEKQIQDLAGRLITAQEEERSHIARDLHDDIGQRVASFSIGLSRVKRQIPAGTDAVLESLSGLQDQAKQLSGDLRRLSHDLHPSAFEHLGLLRALRTRCREFGEETGLPVQLEIADAWPDVPNTVALCLYRVAQEALRNVARHARARHVTVSLARGDGYLMMTIADDGCGFDSTSTSSRPGLGLVSMRERVRSLGGTVGVAAASGTGTTITVRLPIGETDATQNTPR